MTTHCTQPKTPRLPHINDKAYIKEQILHGDLAKIREDMKPIGVRTGAEAMCHVLDRGWRAGARQPAPPRARVGPRPTVHRAHAYEATPAAQHSPPHLAWLPKPSS
jgi:hypothetical protein